MYNHYIPQSDGSYRRNQMPESNRRPSQKPAPPPAPSPPSKPEPKPCPPAQPPRHDASGEKQDRGILSIVRKFLPKEIDSTDLLVIVLLLLLSDQEEEDDLAPLLTIALYFMM